MSEKWRDIPGWEGYYQVSNLGRVKSLERTIQRRTSTYQVKEKILAIAVDSRGYTSVNLCKNGDCIRYAVHHLVARAFLGDPPGPIGKSAEEYQMNHKNGNKSDNRVHNLEYVTRCENEQHSRYVLGNHLGTNNSQSKIEPEDVREIRQRGKNGETHQSISEDYPIGRSAVSMIIRRDRWAWLN